MTSISGHDGPAVACVGYIAHVIDYESNYRTRAGLVNFASGSLLGLGVFKEKFFGLGKAIPDCLERVLREMIVFYNLKIRSDLLTSW